MIGFAKLLTSRPFIGGLAALVVCAIILGGFRHYNGLLDEIEALHATQATLQAGLVQERATVEDLAGIINSWQAAQDTLLIRVAEMQEIAHAASSEARQIKQLFAEIDLATLPAASADSLAQSTIDRLWGGFSATSDPGRYGSSGAAPDSTAAPGPGPD